jgi:glycosyltransferase involved in cell wall biosynthesis
MQALAMQTPVLTTPAGCDGLQMQHNEHLVIAHSQNDMVKSAILLLRDERLRARLQEFGREHVVSNYAWGSIVDRYEGLYERIITTRGK